MKMLFYAVMKGMLMYCYYMKSRRWLSFTSFTSSGLLWAAFGISLLLWSTTTRAQEASSPVAAKRQEEGKTIDIHKILLDAAESARAIKNDTTRDCILSSLSDVYANAGEIEQAVRLAKEIKLVSFRESALARIVRVQYRAGDYDGALKTTENIENAPVMGKMLVGITIDRAETGQRQEAKTLLLKALRIAESIENSALKKEALTMVAIARMKMGDTKGAREVAEVFTKPEERERCLCEIVLVPENDGDIAEYLKWVDAVKSKVHQAYMLVGIADLQRHRGDRAGAVQSLSRAEKIADNLPKQPSDPRVMSGEEWIFSYIAKTQLAMDDMQAALVSIEKIPSKFIKISSLGMAAEKAAEQKKRDLAMKLFGRALKTADTMNTANVVDTYIKNAKINEIAVAQAKAGYMDEAFKTVKTIGEDANDPALAEIAGIQAERGHFDEALKTCNSIVDNTWKPVAFGFTTTGMVKRGESERALVLANQQKNPEVKAMALFCIASAMVEQKKESEK